MTDARRSILITGCSSGIGLASALTLRDRGWHVLATCRKPGDLERLESLGLESFLLDVSDVVSVTKGAEQALDRVDGRLDALFNNAAFACPGAVEDLPREALREIFETNLFGLHDLTRRVLPAMRAQGAGRIVNCSSVLGFVAAPWRGAYVATKFALEGLTDTLRLELRGTPIRVVTIEPGPIESRFRRNAIPHFERWIDWERSPHENAYRTTLHKRLYEGGRDQFQLPARAVAQTLARALDAPRPKSRYRVTVPSHVAWTLRRLLPTRALDAVLSRG
ncbi:SDR family NAD(P)-dependent oxidoreductase [Roseitranquillus sediminis]|uniref:SDR family NAD(P)-dependent oxidoreductase n=1 Tax=Roseitranquillus sediminis TaxID=2809051 RepID=UPI001D0CA7DC|nr:SDR family NAD(P)-dependent oxidoreductase [Roseitranquillus sediminis]MBM9596311.1 SDR family NAD(P)-dependent oxidoreductase [Roseitranquillus sediminis]